MDQVNTELQCCIYVMFALYAILIGATIHNIVRFVIRQKRWKSFHIAYFYVLVPFIIIVRLSWFTSILVVTYYYDSISNNYDLKEEIFVLDVSATYLELLLGIQ